MAVIFDPMLDAVMAAYGKPMTYRSQDGTVVLTGLTGAMVRSPVALDADAENTGGIMQYREVLRVRNADFPATAQPEQGAIVTVERQPGQVETSQVTDTLVDARGWTDLPLAEPP